MMNNTIVNGKESLSMRHNRAPAFSRSILNSNYELTKTENPSTFCELERKKQPGLT